MSFQLTMTYESTTLDFQAAGYKLKDGFFPAAPSDTETPVAERFDLIVTGSSTSDLASKVSAITQALDYARRWNVGPIGAWLNFSPDSSATWRTRVTDGYIALDAKLDPRWRQNKAVVSVVLEHLPYWEGPEVQVPLTNGNGSQNTNGLNVYNSNDGSGNSPNIHQNYAEISAGSVGGNLPAACRIEMTNQYNISYGVSWIWMAHNVYADPANFQHYIPGASAAYPSGGASQSLTWTGDTQQLIARWTLNTAYLNSALGRWFKVLAVTNTYSLYGIWLQAKITYPSGSPLTVVGSGQETALTDGMPLQDIGTIQIPPWLTAAGNLEAVDLCIYARKTGGGSMNFNYLQITPLDSYRILRPRGYELSYQQKLVDDSINNYLYLDDPSGKAGYYTAVGDPIKLIPGKLQRLYFLQMGSSGDILAARSIMTKLFYRPRRASL
jgi:hypothetical protein